MLVREFAWQGPDKKFVRNMIGPCQDYTKHYHNVDFHATWAIYTTSEYTYGEMVGNFPMDFDDAMNPDNSRLDALNVIEHFKLLGVKPTDFYIKFSGNKGYHLELPYEKFLVSPDLHLVDIYRAWAEEIKSKLKYSTLDMQLYEAKRLLRFPNTINSKSGLYCRYITYADLRDKTTDQIREMATTKGPVPIVSKDKVKNLQTIYEKYKKAAEADWKSFKTFAQTLTWDEKDKLPCISGLLKEGAGSGERNRGAYVLACYYKKIGKTIDHCTAWLEKEYCHVGEKDFGIKDIRTVVNSAYKSHRDGIGCRNYLMQAHCDKEACPLHNKKDEINAKIKSRKLNDTELSELILKRQEAGDYDITLLTGLPRLDVAMPIRRSDLIFILAPPGSGKTTLMFNFIANIALTEKVLYFPLEEDEIDTEDRKRNLKLATMPNLDYYGMDMGYVNIFDIEAEAASGQYKALFIDQLNKVMLSDKTKSNFREYFTNVCIELRRITKQYKVPIFVLHQLGRGWEKEKFPTFSLFKETSAIEEEATRVLCFWCYEYNQHRQSLHNCNSLQNQGIWNFDIYVMKGRGIGISKVPVIYNMRTGEINEHSAQNLPFQEDYE